MKTGPFEAAFLARLVSWLNSRLERVVMVIAISKMAAQVYKCDYITDKHQPGSIQALTAPIPNGDPIRVIFRPSARSCRSARRSPCGRAPSPPPEAERPNR